MSMSLEDERRELAEIRQLGCEGALFEHEGPGPSLAWRDQVDAAIAETEKRIRSLEGQESPDSRGPYEHVESDAGREMYAVLLAGTYRCLRGHSCRHTDEGDRPLIAFFAARVITCRECASGFRGAMVAQDRRAEAGLDRICDFCLEESEDNQFVPIVAPFGPVECHGDMCSQCDERLRPNAEVVRDD